MSGSDSPTFFHGQPWSNWIEKIGRDKPLSDEEPENEPASSVMRLSVDDIDLYGFCPERDTFYGVVCEICNSIVKPQALTQHMESRHPTGASNLPPPSNSTPNKPAMKTPYCKLSKLKKSQSSGQLPVNSNNSNSSNSSKTSNNHTPVKSQRAAEQQSNVHSGISGSSPRSPHESSMPCVQSSSSGFTNAVGASGGGSVSGGGTTTGAGGSPVKSPGSQPKRKRLKTERSLLKDREYDPDRHCGVWNEETGKPCTRSLTCKAHTVSLRRTVSGRSKTFDKLLAEHRAAKELPSARSTPAKVTSVSGVGGASAAATTSITGSISIASAESVSSTASSGALAPSTPSTVTTAASTPAATAELETPNSPPVLSLPDTYPLPQAVDLLYRCLAPHGSNKPTKLEEDFANELESSNRRIESSVVSSSSSSSTGASAIIPGGTSSSITAGGANSAMTPISVVLPSLSPIPTGGISPQASLLQYSRNIGSSSPIGVDQIINKQSPAAAPVVPTAIPVSNQPVTSTTAALEAKTAPIDIDSSQNITMYTSPVYKDIGKSQVTVQISRANMINQSPASRSYASLFDSTLDHHQESTRPTSHVMTNGKRMTNHHHASLQSNQVGGRTKHEFKQEYSTAIQLEATTASTPYTSFSDISWTSCHPEPLAVSRWLRINSSRKQYNFNIH